MGDGKILVPSVGRIWYQSPDVEVVLRFQEPGWGRWGGGVVVGGYFMSHLLQDRRFLGPFIGKRIE